METEKLMKIKNRVVHAAALAGILSMAVTDIAPSSDINGTCEVLCDYMNETTNIIEKLIFIVENSDEQQGMFNKQ